MTDLKTIPDFLNKAACSWPAKTALVFNEQTYNYEQIAKRVEAIASFLINKTEKGEVVGLLLNNSPEFIFSYFAILKAGLIALLLPANISDKSLVFQTAKTKPKLIISQGKFKEKLTRTSILATTELIEVEQLPQTSETILVREPVEEDPSTIIFTSGTTSEPKGVKLKHCNVVAATKNIIQFLGWNEKDIDVNILQLSHSFGLGNVHSAFATGATVVLFPDAINLKKILETIIASKVTTFAATPTTLRLILAHYQELFRECGRSLRFVQTDTSLLEQELIENMLTVLPQIDFNYYYGLSEASRSTFITLNNHPQKRASVGRASPNVQLKIVDQDDKLLPAGQTGEVCIKGTHVIKDYWQNEQASKKIKDGWLHTGDAGCLDQDGFLFFKGRNDDIINVAGEKVSPEEIEEVAKKAPEVLEAAAAAMPDKFLGEAVKLFIVVENQDFEKETVIKLCRQELESYKVPRVVEIIKQIPKTENGKLQRAKLKNL